MYNGDFPNTGLADKCRVVLVLSGKNLNDAFNLLMATDDGIECTTAKVGGKINTHLVNGGGFGGLCVTFMWYAGLTHASASCDGKIRTLLVNGGGFGGLCVTFMWCARLIQHEKGLYAYFLQIDSQAFEDTSGDAFPLVNQSEQEVFCPYRVLREAISFISSKLDGPFGAWSQADRTCNDTITTTNNKFYATTNFVQVNTEMSKYFGRNAFPFLHKTKQQMLCANIVMLEAP